eukprot:jgi/Ulvmu1/6892/UM031_0098.1
MMLAVSAFAFALLLAPGAQAQQECGSLYSAIQTHNQQMANANPSQSISTFTALLNALGLNEARVNQLGSISSNVLIPNDQAFASFVEEAAGPNADPVSFIMTQPDAFKQILLFHFTGPLQNGEGELHTAIEAVSSLADQGWIDPSAICGREDSKYVHIKYTADADDMALKFTEPIGQHFMANEVDRPCDTADGDAVTAIIVDRVLTPCPISMMFSRCMTVAAAAAEIPNHPFGTAPYDLDDDSSVVSLLKNPNLLSSGGGASYSVFVPTATALVDAGVTAPEFMATPGALDHVVSGHVIAEELCLGGAAAANGEYATKLDGVGEFCGGGGAVTVTTGGQGAVTVTSGSGATAVVSGMQNIAVCGGVVHVVNDVLLPCKVAAYSLGTPEVPQEERGGVDVPETAGEGSDDSTTVTPLADSATSVVTSVLAAAVALGAALAM